MVEQLKEQLNALVHETNMMWFNAFEKCKASGEGFEYSKVLAGVSKGVNISLEQIFAEFRARNKNEKGWWKK